MSASGSKPPAHQPSTRAPEDATDHREMYTEIAALLGAIAQAFAITEAQAIAAAESGRLTMSFERDANGNRFVAASLAEPGADPATARRARVYHGAIKREGG